MAGPLGAAPGIILGVGLGTAGAAAIEPIVEPAKQQAWYDNPNRILDAARMAALVAQGGIALDTAATTAQRDGFDLDKFRSMVFLAQRAPSHAEAQDLRRRGKITLDQLYHAFAKEQIETQYWEALAELVDDRLSPQVVALAIVRGLMVNPGILPVGPPSAVGKVPAFPVSQLDPVTESAASGFDKDRLAVLAGIMGRPMGPESAASAAFRGILERVDFDRAISEGDVRNEWADAIFETARQIPSVSDAVNLRIRGWITDAEMHAISARHGMTAANTDLLLLRTGRPATGHQVFIGNRRGGSRNGSTAAIPPDFVRAVEQSDIRPEWTNLLWAGTETYPSGFMIRGAVQSGDLTPAQAKQLLFEVGWKESWIDVFVEAWSTGKSSADPDAARVKLATSQAVASLKKAFLTDRQDGQAVIAGLELLGIKASPAGQILETWTVEKGWTEKELTPSQIKKVYSGGAITIDEAVAALERLRYTEEAARLYLTT